MTATAKAPALQHPLMEQFASLFDASSSIEPLRQFILDLAVRGKLIDQDTCDEQAPEHTPIHRGVDAQGKHPPYELPHSWKWSSLADVSAEVVDCSHSTPIWTSHGKICVRTTELNPGFLDLSSARFVSEQTFRDRVRRLKPEIDDVLYCREGKIGSACRIPAGVELCMGQRMMLIRAGRGIYPAYLEAVLNSPLTANRVATFVTGLTAPRVNVRMVKDYWIPVPPLAEQQRIVAKIDELLALCDRLKVAKAERERRRDRLVSASTKRLINSPKVERKSISFYLGTLPRQATRPEHVQQLRQAILSLAVRGAIVPQRADDRPIGGLDTRGLDADNRPFEIPSTWRWARLESLGTLRGGGTPSKSVEDYWNGDIPWVSPKDMKQDYIDHAQMSITPDAIKSSSASLIDKGSILFVVRGMILAHSFPVALARVAVTTNQDMKALVLKVPETGEYLLRALKALKPIVLSKVQRSSHGTCRLEAVEYSSLPIPLPPLAEQRRIVQKVDELMALCDRLEAALETRQAGARRLLESLLHQALHAPA